MLSYQIFGGEGSFSLRSRKRDSIKSNSAIVFAMDFYSTSVEDREIVGCFLELQEIKLEPRKTQYTSVDVGHLGNLPNLHLRMLEEMLK
jgi:hypothetical protein